MSKITRMGIDQGKNTFHVCAMARAGRVVLEKRFARHRLEKYLRAQPPCVVGMEACSGARHWARALPLQMWGGPYKRGLPACGRPMRAGSPRSQEAHGPRKAAISGIPCSQAERCAWSGKKIKLMRTNFAHV